MPLPPRRLLTISPASPPTVRFLARTLLTLLTTLVGASLANAADEPVFRDIFPPGGKHAHSSSIVQCADGGLLACWFYGSGERKASDVVVQGARLQPGKQAWGDVFQMADTPEFPDCNPVLFVDAQQRLWMFWITVLAERWECSQLKFRRCDQTTGRGAPDWSWQGVIQLKPGPQFATVMRERFESLGLEEGMWSEYALPYPRLLLQAAQDPLKRQTGWMTRTKPRTLPSGRILLPLYSDGFNASLMAISDDQGKTWQASTPIIGLGPIQPAIVRGDDGTISAYCRDSGAAPGRVMLAKSNDDGETWTPATDTPLPNPGSSLEVLRLSDGRWVMALNDTESNRGRLALWLSTDQGKSWPHRQLLEPDGDQAGSFDYPCLIQTRDGKIHVTYSRTTSAGRCIRHAVVSPEWIAR